MFEASRVLQEEEQTSSEMDKLRATMERYRKALESIVETLEEPCYESSDRISICMAAQDLARAALGSE